MKIPRLVAMMALPFAASASAEQYGPGEQGPQIRAILLEEAVVPEGIPARGQTVWDRVERAVYETRKARTMIADAHAWSNTGIDRPAQEWANLEERVGRLEKIHREALWPGLNSLRFSIKRTRGVGAKLDSVLKSREIFAELSASEGPSNAFGIEPRVDTLLAVRGWREDAEGLSAQAEEMLEKALRRLREPKPARSPAYSYLDDLIAEAESSLEGAAAKALELAQAQLALTGKGGLYWEALAAAEAYGGPAGTGPYDESGRAKAVSLSNAAKRRLVANEYTMASRIEETRTMDYLLDRFGKL